MSDAQLNYFIYNDNFYPTKEYDRLYIEDSKSLYEVIRVNNSIPLFLDEHIERLFSSAKIINYKLKLNHSEIKLNIISLINKNNVSDYNLKIVINNLENPSPNIYYFFIKTNYPDSLLYDMGIRTLLYNAKRDNPNAKIINKTFRDSINNLLKEKECFEAILVNDDGYVTEGSRSNLFFIRDNTLYTTQGKDVLLGITRKRIIDLAKKNGVNVIEKPIHIDELSGFSSLFISGTSPKVLPIKSVDNINYLTKDTLLLKIISIYDSEIISYMDNYKSTLI